MEEQKRIEQFLSVPSNGYGYGDGNGYGDSHGYGYGDGCGGEYGDGFGYGGGEGSGNGYGAGYGSGYGYGYGDGNGYDFGAGYGSGDGNGYGFDYGTDINMLNGERIYQIDDVPTLIDSVSGNFAKGRILQSDLTTRPCYIANVGKYFAHGDTLREAISDAQAKYNENRPLTERIAEFNREFPDRDVKVDAARLFDWHHILTGSCLAGRKAFCEDRGLDYEHGHYTVNEFIRLTREAYGGEVIKELEKTLP